MKKIIYTFIWYVFFIQFSITSFAWDLKGQMLWTIREQSEDWVWVSWFDTNPLDDVLKFITDSIFVLLWIIWVWVFLYFGFKLISARWNQEEMKKVLIGFVYAVVGLAIIPLALFVVRLVSSLNF